MWIAWPYICCRRLYTHAQKGVLWACSIEPVKNCMGVLGWLNGMGLLGWFNGVGELGWVFWACQIACTSFYFKTRGVKENPIPIFTGSMEHAQRTPLSIHIEPPKTLYKAQHFSSPSDLMKSSCGWMKACLISTNVLFKRIYQLLLNDTKGWEIYICIIGIFPWINIPATS